MGQICSSHDIENNLETLLENKKLITQIRKVITELSVLTGAYFHQPIVWDLELNKDEILNNNSEHCGETENGIEAFEHSNGVAVFQYRSGQASVSSFAWLERVLSLGGDSSTVDLKNALKANPDPLSKILGPAYGGGKDLDQVASETGMKNISEEVLVALETMNRTFVLSGKGDFQGRLEYVAAELKLIKELCGIDKIVHCLESIDWESAYVSNNGLRAPPWRQKEGDLAYISVKPFDTLMNRTVLISKEGCCEIEGMKEGEMSYNKVGGIQKNLTSVVKAMSSHCADILNELHVSYFAPLALDEQTGGGALGNTQRASTVNNLASRQGAGGRGNSAAMTPSRTQGRRSTFSRGLAPSTNWTPLLGESRGPPTTHRSRGTSKQSYRSTQTRTAGGAGGDYDPMVMTGGVYSVGEFDSDEDDTDDEDEEIEERRPVAHADLPAEYWQIQKLVKYLSSGNETATIIALCSLRDFDLTKDTCQYAIQDVKGLDILVNLLDAPDERCKVGALQILQDVTGSPYIQQAVADLNGVKALVKVLDADDENLRALAARTIANCAKLARNRKVIKQTGGVFKLVELLRGPQLDLDETTDYNLETAGAMALWSCCKSQSIRRMVLESDAVPLLAELIQSKHEPLLVPIVGIVEECADMFDFRQYIRSLDMISHIVNFLGLENEELKAHTACAVFKCAEDPEARIAIKDSGGVELLVNMLASKDNKIMLTGVTGSIWKCALEPSSNTLLAKAGAVEALVPLMTDQPEDVLINVVGALSELTITPATRKSLRSAGGIDQLVKLLASTNEQLLINVTSAIGSASKDKDNMAAIDKLDGVRLLWSLLKSPTPEVQAGAAWAVCPCIQMAADAGEMVRSFVGGLELVVGLLKSEHIEVLASVCAAVAQIAKDEENLAVITDYGVVPMLGRLTPTTHDKLRQHLASAIAECCSWGSNRIAFGQADAVAPLEKYLHSEDPLVHRSTAQALCQLSQNPENCITMHQAGVVKPLIRMVGSEDWILQEAAAQCLANIRRLALVNEISKYK